MASHTELEIAQSIVKQFPSTTIKSLEQSVKSYKKINAWKTNLQATEASFTRLQDVMTSAGELDKRADFSKIVDNTLAKEVFG